MTKKKPTKEELRKRFVSAAHELECDESEAAFNAKLKKLAGAKAPTPKKPKGKRNG